MVKIFFIEIIENIRELACYSENKSYKANEKNNKKMRRNSFFYRRNRRAEKFEFQKLGFYEFNAIKAKEGRRDIIEEENHKIAQTNHIKA